MTSLSDYLEDKVINWIRGTSMGSPPSTIYLALFTSPTTDAGGGTEVVDGSYVRMAVTLAAPSPPGVTTNSGTVTYPVATADWGLLTHAAVYDASSGGNLLLHGPILVPQTILTDNQLVLNPGAMNLVLN